MKKPKIIYYIPVLISLMVVATLFISCTKSSSDADITNEYNRISSKLTITVDATKGNSSLMVLGDSLASGYTYNKANTADTELASGNISFGAKVAEKIGQTAATATANGSYIYRKGLTEECAGLIAAGNLSCWENITYGSVFNNVAIPSVRIEETDAHVSSVVDKSAASKGLIPLFLRNTAAGNLYGSSMLDQIVLGKPSLVLVWIGANNILGPASGGYRNSADTATATLLPKADFKTHLEKIISRIQSETPAKIILANLPEITAVPLFEKGNLIMAGVSAATGLTTITLEDDGTEAIHTISTFEGLIISTDQTTISNAMIGTATLPDKDWLSKAELLTLSNALTDYNTVISETAEANTLTVVDMKTVFDAMKNSGTESDTGLSLTTTNAFGEDFVHPNAKGQRGIANLFIDAINTTYGTSYEKYTE